MKQLDVAVSPPAFIWDPNLTLTHVTFDVMHSIGSINPDEQTEKPNVY